MKSFKLDKKASKNELSWFGRHKILTGVVVALLLVGAIGANVNPSKDDTSSQQSPSKYQNLPSSEPIGLNTPARDGKFEFVVKNVECGQSEVGTAPFTKTPQGQFCTVTLSVKNIGDKSQSLYGGDQKLFNATGAEYSPDTVATTYASPNNQVSFYSQINPGNTAEGIIVFDIPADQTPTTMELHDSSYSSGVKVKLN